MSRSLTSAAILLASMVSAAAADLPQPAPLPPAPVVYAPPPYNWSGFYIGANGGWGFASGNSTVTTAGGLIGATTGTGTGSFNGGIVGGQIGVNYQIDALVLGLEGDIDYSGQSRTDSFGCGVACTISETIKIPWLATVRGRIGVAMDRVLLYGTGGVAFTNVSDNVGATGIGSLFSASSTNTGWTGGAGVEVALGQNWTARAEYLYVQTNASLNGTLGIVGGTVNETATFHDSLVRAGVNFKYP